MKGLDQLGISPVPWSVYEAKSGVTLIEPKDGVPDCLASMNVTDGDECFADAQLIAAAPDLYRRLYEAVASRCFYCEFYSLSDDRCKCRCGVCSVQDWRKALEDAGGGEEECGGTD